MKAADEEVAAASGTAATPVLTKVSVYSALAERIKDGLVKLGTLITDLNVQVNLTKARMALEKAEERAQIQRHEQQMVRLLSSIEQANHLYKHLLATSKPIQKDLLARTLRQLGCGSQADAGRGVAGLALVAPDETISALGEMQGVNPDFVAALQEQAKLMRIGGPESVHKALTLSRYPSGDYIPLFGVSKRTEQAPDLPKNVPLSSLVSDPCSYDPIIGRWGVGSSLALVVARTGPNTFNASVPDCKDCQYPFTFELRRSGDVYEGTWRDVARSEETEFTMTFPSEDRLRVQSRIRCFTCSRKAFTPHNDVTLSKISGTSKDK